MSITVGPGCWADLTNQRSGWVAVAGAELVAARPCAACHGSGALSECCDGDEDPEDHETTADCFFACPTCKGRGLPLVAVLTGCVANGKVFAGYATVSEVLPIVRYSDWEIAASPTPCVTVDDGHAIWMQETDDPESAYGIIICLPAARPGMYAVRVEPAEP